VEVQDLQAAGFEIWGSGSSTESDEVNHFTATDVGAELEEDAGTIGESLEGNKAGIGEGSETRPSVARCQEWITMFEKRMQMSDQVKEWRLDPDLALRKLHLTLLPIFSGKAKPVNRV
jgi:hypothetical protein